MIYSIFLEYHCSVFISAEKIAVNHLRDFPEIACRNIITKSNLSFSHWGKLLLHHIIYNEKVFPQI